MDPLIYELWEITIKYGYITRKSNKDGLFSWNEYKKLIPEFSIVWKESSKSIYDELKTLDVIVDDFDIKFGISKEEWVKMCEIEGDVLGNTIGKEVLKTETIQETIQTKPINKDTPSLAELRLLRVAYYNKRTDI